jgi:hypothetical protein
VLLQQCILGRYDWMGICSMGTRNNNYSQRKVLLDKTNLTAGQDTPFFKTNKIFHYSDHKSSPLLTFLGEYKAFREPPE